MYNKEVEAEIHDLFRDLQDDAEKVIAASKSYKAASDRIVQRVSSRLACESEGYIVDIYAALTAKIKEDDFFQDPNHLNAFYRLNLREALNEKYHFEVTSLDAYKSGIEFREINSLYMTAGAAAGTLAVGGILKFALSGVINIPFALIIAGALVLSLAAYSSIPPKNKRELLRATTKYLSGLESELLDWVVEIEGYFDSQVRALYAM